MDQRKKWICPKCGARLTDEQRVREGCQGCLMQEFNQSKETEPIATEIHVSREGYNVIMENAYILDNLRREELQKFHNFSRAFNGIDVLIKEYEDIFVNQARVIYSNGSNKLITLY